MEPIRYGLDAQPVRHGRRAGILFLPINAGIGGFWPLVAMALLVGPMTYLSHRGLSRFVCSGSRPDADITEVVSEHFGPLAGRLITIL